MQAVSLGCLFVDDFLQFCQIAGTCANKFFFQGNLQQYNLDYIGREVIRTYVNMDTAARVSISRFVMQLTRNVERSEAEMLAQQATTENDPNAAEVAT